MSMILALVFNKTQRRKTDCRKSTGVQASLLARSSEARTKTVALKKLSINV